MKKLSYLLIIALVAPMFFVTSCEGTKRHDFEDPKIEWIRFNMNDTVIHENKVYWVNDTENTNPSEPDIIIIGHPLKISGHFTDNMGLSAGVVRIWGDTLMEYNMADTCYRYRKVPSGIQLFGYTERTINDALLEDKVPAMIISNNPNRTDKDLKVRESKSLTDTEYNFSVFCTDIEGNQDLISFEKKPLIFLTRDSYLKSIAIVIEKPEPKPE